MGSIVARRGFGGEAPWRRTPEKEGVRGGGALAPDPGEKRGWGGRRLGAGPPRKKGFGGEARLAPDPRERRVARPWVTCIVDRQSRQPLGGPGGKQPCPFRCCDPGRGERGLLG